MTLKQINGIIAQFINFHGLEQKFLFSLIYYNYSYSNKDFCGILTVFTLWVLLQQGEFVNKLK